jgi:hypothetical protein
MMRLYVPAVVQRQRMGLERYMEGVTCSHRVTRASYHGYKRRKARPDQARRQRTRRLVFRVSPYQFRAQEENDRPVCGPRSD